MWDIEHCEFVMRRFYSNGKSVTQTQRNFRIQFNVARHGVIPDRNTILRWIRNVNMMLKKKKPPGHSKTVHTSKNVSAYVYGPSLTNVSVW
ncbi:hypothetical protein C0J52_21230 [Blattella germanica]|nr:hypothetical protein C0J52_21230 [Blattella germanica]